MWQPRHCWQPTFRVTFDNDRQHDETNEDTARQKWMKQRWVWCWRSWNWETLGDEDTKGSTHHLAPRLKITPFYIPIFPQHVDDGEISLMIAISRCWQRWCWWRGAGGGGGGGWWGGGAGCQIRPGYQRLSSSPTTSCNLFSWIVIDIIMIIIGIMNDQHHLIIIRPIMSGNIFKAPSSSGQSL